LKVQLEFVEKGGVGNDIMSLPTMKPFTDEFRTAEKDPDQEILTLMNLSNSVHYGCLPSLPVIGGFSSVCIDDVPFIRRNMLFGLVKSFDPDFIVLCVGADGWRVMPM
jgi:hypothetical protein